MRLRHQGDFLTNVESDSKDLRVMVQLPTGRFSHATMVNALTAIITVGCAAAIAFLTYREATRPPSQELRSTAKAVDRMEKQKGHTAKEAVIRQDVRSKATSVTHKSTKSTPVQKDHRPTQKTPSSSTESKGKKPIASKSKKF